MTVPGDLAAALASILRAQENFAAFPRSAKRGNLEWIAQAKTEPTRAKRIAETARLAGIDLRANTSAARCK